MNSAGMLKLSEEVRWKFSHIRGVAGCYINMPTCAAINRGGSRISEGRVSNPSERGTGGRAPEAGRGQSIMFGALEPRAWRAREREPITGVWGRSPQRGPGAEPLVRGSGRRSHPEAENLLAFGCATEAANLPHAVRTLTGPTPSPCKNSSALYQSPERPLAKVLCGLD